MPPNITAAAAPLNLKGVEYSVSPLSDRDCEELNNWIRARLISIARKSFTSDMDQEARDELLGAAVREAGKIDFMTGRGFRDLTTPEGCCRMLYQSLRRHHPGITVEAVKALLYTDGKPDRESISAFAQIFSDLNMPEQKKSDGEAPQENGAPKAP